RLVALRPADRAGRRRALRPAGHDGRGAAVAPSRGYRGRRDHEGRPQPAENPPGAFECRPARRGGLCRAWHHAGRKIHAAFGKARRYRALFLAGARARLERPPMTGRLHVIGTGPGNPDQMTPEALRAVEASTEFFGYFPDR